MTSKESLAVVVVVVAMSGSIEANGNDHVDDGRDYDDDDDGDDSDHSDYEDSDDEVKMMMMMIVMVMMNVHHSTIQATISTNITRCMTSCTID